MRSDTILFDVNETLLDLSLLREPFRLAFGSDAALPTWFARVLHASTVCAATGVKTGFKRLAQENLQRTAAEAGVSLTPAAQASLLGTFAHLPPHPDVVPSLRRLRAAGLRCFAFSNSSNELLAAQMRAAGLLDLLEGAISVERFGSFKPDPAVYRGAARLVEREPPSVWLVACHDWDCHGAMQAGLRAAWVQRGRAARLRVYRRPELEARTMEGIVREILGASQA
ncbi:MAG: haloacid dehalogenase type II [Myxococcota bacterium]